MKLNEKIRIIRKARGYSQEQLGELLSKDTFGLSRQSISNWEKGESEPKLENIRDLSRVLNVSYDALLDDEIDLNNQKVLLSILNNDYEKDKLNSLISMDIYKSNKYLKVIVASIMFLLLVFFIVFGICYYKSIDFSEQVEIEESTYVMGKLDELKKGLEGIQVNNIEEQRAIYKLFIYAIIITIEIIMIFIGGLIINVIKSEKKIGSLDQHALIIYQAKIIYIPYEDIESITNEKDNLIVKTKKEEMRIKITNSNNIISFYNELKVLANK